VIGALKAPDTILVKDQMEAMKAMQLTWPIELLMSTLFWILPRKKEFRADGRQVFLTPFRCNPIQKWLETHCKLRNLLLKPRQIGGTTWFLLRRLLLPALLEPGTGSILISQSNDYVEKHFMIARRAYRLLGCVDPFNRDANHLSDSLLANLFHTTASNRRELIFDQLESRVMVESAEVTEAGQGVTLHHILADEYSRWPHKPEETLSNVQGALVKDGTLDKNCTANGAVGPFYLDCMRAMNSPDESDAVMHFFPWWWEDEYVMELDEKQKDTLEADLTEEELFVIKKIHLELDGVAWTGTPQNRVFVA
jgi:hypothetical protein